MVESRSGKQVNIFEESDISFLGKNAVNVDRLLEKHVGLKIAKEKLSQIEVDQRVREVSLQKSRKELEELGIPEELLKKMENAIAPRKDAPRKDAQLARDRLMMKNKRTSDMILKNLDKLLLTKKIAKDKFKLDDQTKLIVYLMNGINILYK